MKFFIVGLHASGKLEILDTLERLGVKCGKIFTNVDISEQDTVYKHNKYEYFNDTTIADIFENNAYIFIHEIKYPGVYNIAPFYEGLTKYEFDNNQVFALSPDQIISIPAGNIPKDVCVIWIDNSKTSRLNRYNDEHRRYNFQDKDNTEKSDIYSYVRSIYGVSDNNILYFTDEDPSRISTIIYTLIKHPDMTDMFLKNFNS